jgi:thiaminase
MELVATNRERIAQDVAYRFHGRDMYFRLNVERGLQQETKPITLGDIETHMRNYLSSPGVTQSVDKLVDTLLRATEPPEWSTTTEIFERILDEYISDTQKWVDNIQSNEVKTAAQEVVRILEAIRVRIQVSLLRSYH